MQATTPTGSLTTSECPSCCSIVASRMNLAFIPIIATGNSACTFVAKPSAVPTSWAMASASWGTRDFRAAANRSSHCARSSIGTRLQVSKPQRAALTARSTSPAVPIGTRPMTVSVDEDRTSMPCGPCGACQGAVVVVRVMAGHGIASLYSEGLYGHQRTSIHRDGRRIGLGRAAAEAIIAAGGSAVLLDVNAETGEAAATALGAAARFARADVTSEAEVQAAVDLAKSAFGNLYGVVNAAGIGPAAKVLGRNGPHPLDLFEKTIRVNLVGTFNVIRLAAAAMAQNEPLPSGERGVIVNTASIAAYDGQIGQPAYAASKGGIVGLTLPVAREFASMGIRCVTIAPGIFDTPLLAALRGGARLARPAGAVPSPGPAGRDGALARHIIENEMLNGEVIRLDGALRMAPK